MNDVTNDIEISKNNILNMFEEIKQELEKEAIKQQRNFFNNILNIN